MRSLPDGDVLSLPKGWEVKKLGEVCLVIGGGTPSKKIKKYYNGDILWASVRDMNIDVIRSTEHKITEDAVKNSSTNIIPKGNVVIATRVGLGKVCLLKSDAAINQDIKGIIPINKKVLFRGFLFIFFKSISKKIIDEGTGATIQGVKLDFIKSLLIPLPPLSEQKRIVAILDKAFTAIAKAKANTEQNLKNAREVFQSTLQTEFENGKRKIESGEWEEKTLGEVIHKTETVNPQLNPNEEFIYLDVSSVNKETKQIENTSLLLGKDAPSRARKLIKTKDVIFATVRPTHSRVAIITEEFDNQVCSTGYYVLRAKEFLSNRFIYYFLLTVGFNKQMEKLQKGASYPAVTNKEVESRKISYPKSLEEQHDIVKKLDRISNETKKLETIYQQKTNDLDEIKKSILQKAFSGGFLSRK